MIGKREITWARGLAYQPSSRASPAGVALGLLHPDDIGAGLLG